MFFAHIIDKNSFIYCVNDFFLVHKLLIAEMTSVHATQNYSVEVSYDLHDSAWDQFIASCHGGHHEQTSLWGQVKSHYGWQPVRIIVSRDGAMFGGVQILIRRLDWLGNIGYVTRGPVTSNESPELLKIIIAALDNFAISAKLQYLAVVPSYTGHHFVPFLDKADFIPKPDFLPPSGVMRASLVLDLTENLDAIMARMRKDFRRNLSRGLSSDFVFREGEEHDIETFRRLMWTLCERRHTSPSPPQKDFFYNLWHVFHARGHVKLFLIEFDRTPVSAVIVFPFGNYVRFWKIGWSGEHGKLGPNALLYWEVIKWSKKNGYRYFDFVWIDLESALALLRGETVRANDTNGMSFFKIGFGGQAIILPEQYCKFYSPIAQLFLKFGGRQLIYSKLITRMIDRIGHSNYAGGG